MVQRTSLNADSKTKTVRVFSWIVSFSANGITKAEEVPPKIAPNIKPSIKLILTNEKIPPTKRSVRKKMSKKYKGPNKNNRNGYSHTEGSLYPIEGIYFNPNL